MCLFPKVFLQIKSQFRQYFKIEIYLESFYSKFIFCQQESTVLVNTNMQYTKQICKLEHTVHFNSLPVLNIYQYFA